MSNARNLANLLTPTTAGTIPTDLVMSGTTPTLTIGDAGAEDTAIIFDGNAQDFHIGLDDSADDLVIGKGSALGTTPALSIDENLIITQVTSMVKPIVTLVATDAITIAEHAGRTLLMGEVGGNVLVHSLCACSYSTKIYSDVGTVFSCLNILGYDYTHEDIENLPKMVDKVLKELND